MKRIRKGSRRKKDSNPRVTRFQIQLPDDFVILVEYGFKKSLVTHFATVLVRLLEEEGSEEICRYDTAHGFAHLDVLDNKRRVIDKIPIPGDPSYKSAVEYAINDLKTNYKKYWNRFKANAKR